jgi:hypothetical protein
MNVNVTVIRGDDESHIDIPITFDMLKKKKSMIIIVSYLIN